MPPRHGGRGRAAPTLCLVLDVTDKGNERWALMARGMPATGRPAKRGDVYAGSADLRGAAGFDRLHVFEASRPIMVRLARVGIESDARTAPVVLGRLKALHRRTAHAANVLDLALSPA